MFGDRTKLFTVSMVSLLFLLSACGMDQLERESIQIGDLSTVTMLTATLSPSPTATPLPRNTITPSPTWTLSWTATRSPTAIPSFTPDPYAELTIEGLAAQSYGGGEIRVEEVMAENSYFTRYLVSYPSDGLAIFGFMNVPQGEGPFPVVIALHGYIDPAVYTTLDYTTGYADDLARAGYLVLHPNLRGYPPSEEGPNLFRVGMARDVLNLIALVKKQGGQQGPLELSDPQNIGLWGHSMGGGISTRVITLRPDVRAAVLYAAMSGDEKQNFEAIFRWSDGERGIEELSVPEEALSRISPIYSLDQIQAAVSIHHGRSDDLVPMAWSDDLCERLQNLNKVVECFTYDNQPHTFYGDVNDLFIRRVIDFFDRHLKDQ